MKVHVVHGILSPEGTSGLLKLVPYLRTAGFDVRVPDYGLITALETRLVNPLLVRTLYPYVERGDLYIGHSNGCAIGYEILTAGVALAGVVFLNAALKREAVIPKPTWAEVYFNSGDDATVAAVTAARLGLSDPVWGDMGHAGYFGDNPAVENIDCGRGHEYQQNLPAVSGHSDIFTEGKVELWAPYIVQRLLTRLKVS